MQKGQGSVVDLERLGRMTPHWTKSGIEIMAEQVATQEWFECPKRRVLFRASPGDWVVIIGDWSRVFVMSDADFRRSYVAVKPS